MDSFTPSGKEQRTNQTSETKIAVKYCESPLNLTHPEKFQSDSATKRKSSQSVVDPNVEPF